MMPEAPLRASAETHNHDTTQTLARFSSPFLLPGFDARSRPETIESIKTRS